MFTPPRFIVVDDNRDHLKAILDVFQELGTPCLGVTYDAEQGLDKANFEGVRALFLDLHLTDSGATTDNRPHFAIITQLLEDNISPAGGPFVLVVWTGYEHEVKGLMDYLDEAGVDSEKPHARPLAVVGLPKDRFINVNTGELLADRADALRTAVQDAVREKPQLAALLHWEADVQAAAGATLAAMVELVPDERRNSRSFADGLDEVLSRLAGATVGEAHVKNDPRAAVNSALAPILADRIVNQQASEAASTLWSKALTWKGGERLGPGAPGTVNRMLHVAVPPLETIRPTDWGAVSSDIRN